MADARCNHNTLIIMVPIGCMIHDFCSRIPDEWWMMQDASRIQIKFKWLHHDACSWSASSSWGWSLSCCCPCSQCQQQQARLPLSHQNGLQSWRVWVRSRLCLWGLLEQSCRCLRSWAQSHNTCRQVVPWRQFLKLWAGSFHQECSRSRNALHSRIPDHWCLPLW